MHLVWHLWRSPYEWPAAPMSNNVADPVALNVFAQIKTAIPNWFSGSFAILNSSVTVLVWHKSGVASEPCLRCLTLGLVWYALIYTEGSPSFFSLMKLYLLQPFHLQSYICCSLFFSKWKFCIRGFKLCDVVDILRCSWQKQIPVFKSWNSIPCPCLKVSQLFLCNVCTFCSLFLF